MNLTKRISLVALVAVLASAPLRLAQAQASISEDFTGTSTSNSWYFFNAACLTAGTGPGVQPSPPGGAGTPPGCTAIQSLPKPSPGSTIGGYGGEPLVGGYAGVAGNVNSLPDPSGNGALRFTNGYPNGNNESGAIVSAVPFPTGQGVAVTFKTVTYRGDSGSPLHDGADGISFFLMDASVPPNIGAYGGSLGYSCAQGKGDGMVGAYIGVGIDEYGNFLNGQTLMPGYAGTNVATGDNSALGYGYRPNRIGIRGAGNVAWSWLNTNYYTAAFPATIFSPAQQLAAVKATCKTGIVADPTNPSTNLLVNNAPVPVADYAPIPNAYVELPNTTLIANESAISRSDGIPIFYSLKITQDGLLSLSYSINGGAYQPVITRQSITASNGPLPANFLFGFAGSTGGSTNIHEILCFKADPATTTGSSAGASEKQSAKLETGAQAYFAFYNPSTWTGRVTASGLGLDTFGNVIVAVTPNWDASCALSGVLAGDVCQTTGVSGPTAAQAAFAGARNILTSTGVGTGGGIPLTYSSLTSSPSGGQQAVINAGDVAPLPSCNGSTGYSADQRVNYLRGDKTCEVNTAGVGRFRARTNILGDIIDSSPTWVGPPISPYAITWSDRLHSAAVMPEAAGTAQTYATYIANTKTRQNVVYVGANDGMLHGFRSGYYDAAGVFNSTGNDGTEVLAYMPATVLNAIHSSTANIDFPNTQYGHAFFVDAAPGTGDVFYGGTWHTWVVGGLGPGGQAIYALDVSNPATFAQTPAAATAIVKGEWNSTNLTCPNTSNCKNNLGNTYGTPQLRRLHDGKWAVIFGNGLGSASGDAGIFIMTLDPSTAAPTFYYISTGTAGTSNGIAYTTPGDLDGDHITDYVYAGDIKGNVWRFDLTSATETSWALTPGPLFKTPAGQPITTAVVLASGAASTGALQQLMVLFGSGQKSPVSITSPATYATGTQTLYGVWDWNMQSGAGSWNTQSAATYAYVTTANAGTYGVTGTNKTLQKTNLQQQVVTINATTMNRDIMANSTVCWGGTTGCTTSATAKFGWYIDLPGTQEQVIFSPELVAQALTVNTIVPASNLPTSCTTQNDTGYTYVVSALTGAAFNQVFLPPSEAANSAVNTNPRYTDVNAIAMQTNATGSSFITGNNQGTKFLVYETNQTTDAGPGNNNILGGTLGLNLPPNTTGKRVSWIQRR